MPDPPQPLPSGFFGFSDDVPPDVDRGLMVPRRADAMSPGSFNVPDLRQRFEETSRGLAVPFEPPKQPLDYMGVTLSFGELLGSPPPLASIDAALVGLPLQLVLLILAMVSAKAERGYRDRTLQDDLARMLLPPWVYPKARGLLADPKRALLAPETPLRLALRALVHCPDKDWGDADLLPTVFTVGQLLLALADNEPPMGDEESIVLGVARMDLFQRWYKKVEWYSVAHDVIFVDLPALTGRPGFFDGESIVETEYGVPLRGLWAVSAIAGLTSTAGEPRRVEALLSAVDDNLATAWRGLYEIGLEELREKAAADLEVASAWSFSAFYDRPIALFGEAGAAIAPTYLMEKATLNGTMWTVRTLLDGDDGMTFTSAVGAAFQRYVERLVRDAVGDPTRVTSETELETRWGKGPLFDLRVEYPDAWVALEFVRRNPTKETQTSGDFVAFLSDLDKAFIEKVEQIDRCLARGAEIDGLPARVFPIVVIGGDYPSNPTTRNTVLTKLGERGLVTVGKDARCREPVAVDVCELRHLFVVAAMSGELLPDLLDRWLKSNLVGVGLSRWLTSEYTSPMPDETWTADAGRWAGLPGRDN